MHFVSAVLACLVVGAVAPPPKHFLNWVCTGSDSDNIPDVCNNMCYGAICKGFGQSMYWDQPDQTTRNRRSRNAGCGTSHKCNSGEQCDEFPFASTSNSDKVSAISRCVPSEQNSRQGAALKQFYYSQGSFKDDGLGGKKGTFHLGFANVGGIRYCLAGADCSNDGNEWNRSGKARRSRTPRRSTGGHYKLSGGGTFFAPEGAEVGDVVWTPRSVNKTLAMEMSRNHVIDPEGGVDQFDYMQHNYKLDREEVVGPADEE